MKTITRLTLPQELAATFLAAPKRCRLKIVVALFPGRNCNLRQASNDGRHHAFGDPPPSHHPFRCKA